MKEQKKVFISYSWDSEEHKAWVRELVARMEEEMIDTVLDENDVVLGDMLTHFMEQAIINSDYVLMICTPAYKAKADARSGGVGYEGNIITADIYAKQNQRKYIPVLAAGTWEMSLPIWAKGKAGVDLSKRPYSEAEFQKLIQTLKGVPKPARTKNVSPKPIYNLQKEEERGDIRILELIKEEMTLPRNDGTRGCALYKIPFRLSGHPSSLWKEIFIDAWNHPSTFTSMHRPGIARVQGNKVILDGTTIEEVQKYHKKTLLAAVEKANEQEKKILEEEEQQRQRERERQDKLRNELNDMADMISFD